MTDIVTYRGTTYPWQCDHIGHMNVMWYVGKFDEASWNLCARIGLTPAYLRDRQRGMAAVQQNIAYHRELLPGDIIEVRSHVLEVRERVLRFEHRMYEAAAEALAAVCEITAVHLDRVARKACAMDPEVRDAAERLTTAEPLPA